jgi:site-specific recombinase XerD
MSPSVDAGSPDDPLGPLPDLVRLMDDEIDQIEELVSRFLDYVRSRNASTHTLRSYRRTVADFFRWCELPPQKVTLKTIEDWLTEFGKDHQPATINTRLAALKVFFTFCQKQGVRADNPAASAKGAKLPALLPKSLPYHDVVQVLESVQGDDVIALRDRAILELGYAIAARVSDLQHADLRDVHLKDRRVILRQTKGGGEAVVCFGEPAAQALRAYLANRRALGIGRTSPALFVSVRGHRLGHSIERIIHKYTTVSPHVLLRHSAATHFLQAGASLADVQAHLRHRNIATTNRYVLSSNTRLQAVYNAHFPRA